MVISSNIARAINLRDGQAPSLENRPSVAELALNGNKKTRIKKPPIVKIFLVQMLLTVVICICYLLVSGSVAAYSSLLGGIIFVLPQLYFGFKATLYSGARSVQKVVVNFYKGESSKLIIIALGFAVVFKFVKPIDYLALYSTFICVLILNCFSALIVKNDQ